MIRTLFFSNTKLYREDFNEILDRVDSQRVAIIADNINYVISKIHKTYLIKSKPKRYLKLYIQKRAFPQQKLKK